MTKTPEELTEKWKTRILPSRWYYIKIEGFKGVDIDLYDKEGNSWLCNSDKDLNPLNVIAPVPTYDEYKAMQAAIDTNKRLCKKIEELCELLKECLPIVSAEIMTWQIRGGEESYKRGKDFLTRINAAFGESEEK